MGRQRGRILEHLLNERARMDIALLDSITILLLFGRRWDIWDYSILKPIYWGYFTY